MTLFLLLLMCILIIKTIIHSPNRFLGTKVEYKTKIQWASLFLSMEAPKKTDLFVITTLIIALKFNRYVC